MNVSIFFRMDASQQQSLLDASRRGIFNQTNFSNNSTLNLCRNVQDSHKRLCISVLAWRITLTFVHCYFHNIHILKMIFILSDKQLWSNYPTSIFLIHRNERFVTPKIVTSCIRSGITKLNWISGLVMVLLCQQQKIMTWP